MVDPTCEKTNGPDLSESLKLCRAVPSGKRLGFSASWQPTTQYQFISSHFPFAGWNDNHIFNILHTSYYLCCDATLWRVCLGGSPVGPRTPQPPPRRTAAPCRLSIFSRYFLPVPSVVPDMECVCTHFSPILPSSCKTRHRTGLMYFPLQHDTLIYSNTSFQG